MAEARSFRDSLKLVMENSNAMKKNAVGMTPDAQKFKDLHKVQDSGVKHMVQKDSEKADYEKMFKPDVGVAKSRLADLVGDESEKQYTQANEEAVEEEALAEGPKPTGFNPFLGKQQYNQNAPTKPVASVQAPAPVAPSRGLPQNQAQAIKNAQTGRNNYNSRPQTTIAAKPVVPTGGNSAGARAVPPPKPTPKPPGGSMNNATPDIPIKPKGGHPFNQEPKAKIDQDLTTSPSGSAQAATPPKSGAPKPTPKPASQNMSKPAAKPVKPVKPVAAKPQAAKVKPQVAKPAAAKPARPTFGHKFAKNNRDDLAMNQRQSYEIEIDGNTYNLSETHMAAVAAFIEKYALVEQEYVEEVEETQEAPTHTDRLKESLNVYFSKKNR